MYQRGSKRFNDDEPHTLIIGLMRVKNEANIIEFSLRALAEFCDGLIVLDDHSSDGTYEIIESLSRHCKIRRIIRKPKSAYSEWEDRTALIQAAREVGATHMIMLDADEVLSANLLSDGLLRRLTLGLEPGDIIRLPMFNLWRSIHFYRNDDSIFSNNSFPVIYCDDRHGRLSDKFIHFPRLPLEGGRVYVINGDNGGILHFQFINWKNLQVKLFWYKCLEKIYLPEKNVREINSEYDLYQDESGLILSPVPHDWLSEFNYFDAGIFSLPATWRGRQIHEWFAKYGSDFFAGLGYAEVVEQYLV